MQSFFWVIPALVLAVAVFYSVVAVAIRDEETERTLFDPVFPVSFAAWSGAWSISESRIHRPQSAVRSAGCGNSGAGISLSRAWTATSALPVRTTPSRR